MPMYEYDPNQREIARSAYAVTQGVSANTVAPGASAIQQHARHEATRRLGLLARLAEKAGLMRQPLPAALELPSNEFPPEWASTPVTRTVLAHELVARQQDEDRVAHFKALGTSLGL